MKVKVKKLDPNAVIPKYSKQGDAGLDLVAISSKIDSNGNIVYGTGLAFEIPEGYVGFLLPRSSNANKDLLLTNHCGVLDSGYRGEVMFKYAPYRQNEVIEQKVTSDTARLVNVAMSYNVGERIGQIIILPYPIVDFEESEELSETERGQGGYGSTGA